MSDLGPDARSLIETVGDADGPTAEDRRRVRGALFGALAAGGAVTGNTTLALGAQSAALGGAAAKGGTAAVQIALWLVVGGAAGLAVATPVALYANRTEPQIVAPAPVFAAQARGERQAGTAVRRERPAGDTLEPPAGTREVVAPVAIPAMPARSDPRAPALDLAPSIGSEVELLKSAQRELAAGHPSSSLALLDNHARRFPTGTLRAERLAARVFALCELGQIEPARAAAQEFLSVAADSPLVPRVVASCAGPSAAGAER